MDVNDLTPIVLQSFVTELLSSGNDKTSKGLSANTVNAIISVLQNSLRTAHLIGYAKDYTANMIKRPKLKERKIECFTLAEQKKIESAVFDSKKTKMFGIVLCLYTGLRVLELKEKAIPTVTFVDDNKYRIWGFHFFNTEYRSVEFESDMNTL